MTLPRFGPRFGPESESRTGPTTRASARRDEGRGLLKLFGWLALGVGLVWATESRAQDEVVIKSHGYSFYGDLKYPADYTHFDYVNPDAPKGGEISIATLGTFDSMNPYSRKGRSGALSTIMYESLLGEGIGNEPAPADVYAEYYCLLCESLEYDEGKNWVIFHMRPEARFSDGTPVTAHDVAFSQQLILDQGLQSYADAVSKRIDDIEVIDNYTIKYTFNPEVSRRSLIEVVGGMSVWSKAWFEETGERLDESRLVTSPGSGPYMIKEIDVNRRIVYERNPDYWGKDLPFNAGRGNFDTIRVEYVGDENSAFEAFKAGVYTFRSEGNSKQWASAYDFPKVQNGQIVKEEVPDGSPPTPSGIVFNLGREVLQDKRVREAIALGYNFEWTNESLQHGLFKQRASFTQDSPLMANGAPEGAELTFLQSLGDIVPPEMMTEEARMPHASSAEQLQDRDNMRIAQALLTESGWPLAPPPDAPPSISKIVAAILAALVILLAVLALRRMAPSRMRIGVVGLAVALLIGIFMASQPSRQSDDGLRRNADGQTLRLTFLLNSSGSATLSAVVENYVSTLKAMGVDVVVDKVDSSQYTERQRERDYDLVFDQFGSFLSTGGGLQQYYGSEAASYSVFNPAGLASPLVDAIIEASQRVETKEETDVTLMALDRALRYEFFMVPVWYNDSFWTAYYDMYEHPENQPAYGLGYLDWWWYNEDKAAALRAAGALR